MISLLPSEEHVSFFFIPAYRFECQLSGKENSGAAIGFLLRCIDVIAESPGESSPVVGY